MSSAVQTIITVAAVVAAPYAAPEIFGALELTGAAGAAATAATAGGLNAIGQAAIGNGGSNNLQNFLSGATGSGLATMGGMGTGFGSGVGLDTSYGAYGVDVNGVPLAAPDGGSAFSAGYGDTAIGSAASAPGSFSATPVAGLDTATQAPALDYTRELAGGDMYGAGTKQAAVSEGAPAGLNTAGSGSGFDFNNTDPNGVPMPGSGVADTGAYSATGAGQSFGDRMASVVGKIPGKMADKLTDPDTLLGLGIKAGGAALDQGVRDRMEEAARQYQDAANQTNKFNMDMATRKAGVADTLVSKANNYDPTYYATQAGSAFGTNRDRQWQDRLLQLQATNASPDQIAAEQRKFDFDTSLGKQTTYQDTFAKGQQYQTATYGQAGGLYTGVTSPSNSTGSAAYVYGARAGDSPGKAFGSVLEDTFDLARSKNRERAGLSTGSNISSQ